MMRHWEVRWFEAWGTLVLVLYILDATGVWR
jgi:hypothetical protein